MIDFQCSELVLNARLAKKLRNGIRLALALVLVSLLFLIFGQGLNTWRFYSYFAVPAFLAAGLCLTYASPCLWIMIIQWRRLSIGRYELSLSHEGIVRKHYRGASLMSQEQWSPSDITQVCISRSVLGREQTLVTFAWFLRALFFGDELYFSVYLVDRQHREHWLLTSTDSEQIRLVYQELSHWLPFASRQDYLDAATHVLRLSPRQSEEGSYHAEFGRAQHLFFAGIMLTGLSLGTGVFAYSCYRNSAASGAWLRSTGTMLNQRVETKVTDGEEIRQIQARVQYPRYKHVVTKQLDLSENELKELGIGLGDAPCELAVYWQKEHPDKLRLSPPLPASRPIYFALLSLGLFVFQVIPLRLLRPHPKEKWQ